ncbi:MAG: DUF366 family protein, partial [Actinomycetia bacterium]|nr:DUF366 family protein [Actinomycetes bacterium]
EFMVDLEDFRNNETIFSNDMLHFIIEIDERDLEKTVLRQRIVISIIKETIEILNENLRIKREGDDLFILKKNGHKKITVSVATLSPASSLIHVGINISSEGIPVPAIGLEEIGVDYKKVAGIVLEKIKKEFIDVESSTLKVKLVT